MTVARIEQEPGLRILGYGLAMRHLSFLCLILLFLLACESSSRKQAEYTLPKFSTSDASELFFKNVRAIRYDKTVMEEAKLDVYRLKEQVETDERPILHLSIVINWRYDEAYVLTEPNAYLQQMDTLKIGWEDTNAQKSGVYTFVKGNKKQHFQLAKQIYESINQGHSLYLLEQAQSIPFMRRKDEQEAFRKTMVDYLRLVDLL